MRKIFTLLFCVSVLLGCDTEDANDCLKSTGTIIEQEIAVASFTRIRTEVGVKLLLKQGEAQEVILKTGENLVKNIEVKVEDGILSARNTATCNLFRDYGETQLIVTAPNITEIRNASQFEVKSEGVLSYPQLTLVSNTSIRNVPDVKKSGEFNLSLAMQKLIIRANGSSVFYIKGSADTLDIRFDDEFPRLEGRSFTIDHLKAFHRGANVMIVNPQQSIDAILTSSGDIKSVNKPPQVRVEERYTGRLIFEE